jgi:outer membrane receptor protein involved in Fe transport
MPAFHRFLFRPGGVPPAGRLTSCLGASLSLLLFAALPLAAQTDEPAAPAPAGRSASGLTGRVFDGASGSPLGHAVVEVEGTGQSTLSTLDGGFAFSDLPEGRYTLTLRRAGYQPARVTGFEVNAASAPLEVSLAPEAEPAPAGAGAADASGAVDPGVIRLETFSLVEAKTLAGSRESFSALRRAASVPVDTLSAQDLSKLVTTDVSDAVVHLPGVSLATRGSFAVIRGLSERYNATTMNGLVMPSSDPDRQSVELDQFPTRLIDGLVVYKGFAPDLPGNLSGGGIDVQTVTFPSRRVLSLTIGASADEGVFDGRDYLTYATKGAMDQWGFGARDRVSMDDIIRAQAGRDGSGELAPDASVPFAAKRSHMPVGRKFAFFYADTFELRRERRLGLSLGISYDVSYGNEEGVVGEGFEFDAGLADGRLAPVFRQAASGAFVPRAQYSYVESQEQVLLGLLANVSLQLTPLHLVTFTAFSTQTGVDTAEYRFDIIDVNGGPPTPEAIALNNAAPAETAERLQYDLRYRERNLTSLALSGRHSFPALNDARLMWTLAANSAYQDEPDIRHYVVLRPYNEDQYEVRDNTTDAESALNRTWRKVEEDQRVAGGSFRFPLDLFWMRNLFLETGGSRARTDRDYREILTSAHSTAPTGILIMEQPEDVAGYVATGLPYPPSLVNLKRDIDALYLKADLPLLSWLKLSGGVRFERTMFASEGFGLLPGNGALSSVLHYTNGSNHSRFFADVPIATTDDTPENRALFSAGIDQTDTLPAVGLALNPIRNLTLRLGYTQTIARPSLRELGNYYSKDDEDRFQHGNGRLQLSDVRNFDFRAEYFFGGTDLVAASLFYKEIDRPIEKVTMMFPTSSGTTVDSWMNNPNTAHLRGVEVEWRRNLGGIGALFEGWTIGGNATYIDASVRPIVIHNADGSDFTEKRPDFPYGETRRLYDQPRWLANADVTYARERWGSSATLSYFVSDRVLSQVQTDFDRYRDRYARLDLAFSQRLGGRLTMKLSVKNLLDPERRYIRDPEQTGGVAIVDRRFHDGRSYSLALTTEF